jgi:septal ring factor EnvC (AmiA/AmiB activator)
VIASSKGKVFVLAVFVLGIVAGVLLSNVYETRLKGADSEPTRRRTSAEQQVKAFHDYLGLNEQQREQVQKIMAERSADFRRLQEETRPQYDAIIKETRARIKALLDDEQNRKYDEWLSKLPQRGQRPPRPNNSSK